MRAPKYLEEQAKQKQQSELQILKQNNTQANEVKNTQTTQNTQINFSQQDTNFNQKKQSTVSKIIAQHNTELLNPELKKLFSTSKSGGLTYQTNNIKNESKTDAKTANTPDELTTTEQTEIQNLKERDQEVRIHENKHKSIGGAYAQSPSYSYTTGPDGKQYIIDGSVSISLSEEKNPQDTIKKMEQVQKAALAPQEPSGADRRVAAEAIQIANRARAQVLKENTEDNISNTSSTYANKQASKDNETNNAQIQRHESSNGTSKATESSNLDYQKFNKMIGNYYNSSSLPFTTESQIVNTFN